MWSDPIGALEVNYLNFYNSMVWLLENLDLRDRENRLLEIKDFFSMIANNKDDFGKLREELGIN